MRLVKKGSKRDKIWKATCLGCSSHFEENESNLNVEYDRDGSLAREHCTECGHEIFFYAADGSSSR